MTPDHPDFESLPRKEQARIYLNNNWTQESIADEFDVSLTTVKRWTNPKYEQRQKDTHAAWLKTPKGQEIRRRYRKTEKFKAADARYRNSEKGILANRARGKRRRERERALSSRAE